MLNNRRSARWAVSIIALVAMSSGCGPSKEERAKRDAAFTVHQLQEFAGRWDSAMALARSSPRIALAIPIRDLQKLQAEVKAIRPAPCLDLAHSDLVDYTGSMVEGMLAFMENNQARSEVRLERAAEEFEHFQADLSCLSTEEQVKRMKERTAATEERTRQLISGNTQ